MNTVSSIAPHSLILAIDQGTHATRALLVDRHGELFQQFSQEIHLNRLDSLRVEQDPLEILGSCETVISEALRYAAAREMAIQTAGLCTQRSTVVAFDRVTGNPLASALSWQDTRGRALTRSLKAKAPVIEAATGLPLSPHFGASKIRWLLAQPEIQAARDTKRLCIAPLAAYLIHQLTDTEQAVVDVANGARTQLMNWQTGDWDPELLNLFGIPRDLLPICIPMRSDFGCLRTGGIPLSAVNGDQGAALLARGPVLPGEARINLGTGGFVSASWPRPIDNLLFSQIDAGEGRDQFVCEGTVNGAGAALAWLADLTKDDSLPLHLNEWLDQCPNPFVFLNHIGGLGSPWWRSGVESGFLNIPMDQALADSRRAACGVAESILFLLKSNLDHMQKAGLKIRYIFVSGGLSQIHALMSRLASLCRVPVCIDKLPESSALGIAWQASGDMQPWRSEPGQSFSPYYDPQLQKRYRQFVEALKNC
jgi:glycerol kinase